MADDTMSFEHASTFTRAEDVEGQFRLGKLEALYQELFADVIEDGIITSEERAELDKMADSLGLDRTRLRRLEQALQGAYEAHHRVSIREVGDDAAMPRQSLVPLEPAVDARTQALERRVAFLEARVVELERDLEEARAHVHVEVDLSDLGAPGAATDDDAATLMRRVRQNPRDAEALHAIFRQLTKAGEADRAWCTAHVLAFLGEANAEERALYTKHRATTLIRPTGAVEAAAWRRLLFHPEEEPIIGDIFAQVASAVLLGRVSAMRRDKALPELDARKLQDPEKSTIQAVRCFHWGAAILGMSAPPLLADPDRPGTVEMLPGIPPVSRLGRAALSGRSAAELAFLAGRHLSGYRQEHFLAALLASTKDLEDVFLAALAIGNPGMPLAAHVKQWVQPLAKAIEPLLEPQAIDSLRGQFLRFVEEGGRANLARWSESVAKTGARAGLLLANDLEAAAKALALDTPTPDALEAKVDDLIAFMMSERYTKLRRQIGIAVG